MIRFTTPVLQLEVEADLTGMEVHVTIEQAGIKLDKTVDDFTVEDGITHIDLPLSQEESGQFNAARQVKIQVNFISTSGDRGATSIESVDVNQNLLDEVIEDELQTDPA